MALQWAGRHEGGGERSHRGEGTEVQMRGTGHEVSRGKTSVGKLHQPVFENSEAEQKGHRFMIYDFKMINRLKNIVSHV